MGVLLLISCVVMLGMMYLGLYLVTDWDPESKVVGAFTLTWVCASIFLLMTQWLPLQRQEPYALLMITALSTAGFIVGKTVAALMRREFWIEDEA